MNARRSYVVFGMNGGSGYWRDEARTLIADGLSTQGISGTEEGALARVTEGRIPLGGLPGADDVERASDFGTGNVVEQIDSATFSSGREVHFKPELIVV